MVEDSPRAPGVDAQLASQWAQVRGRLRSEFGEATFRSWLKPLTLLGVEESAVNIAVKTRFMRDWIQQHYAEQFAITINHRKKIPAGSCYQVHQFA